MILKQVPEIQSLVVPEFRIPEQNTLSNGIVVYGFPGIYHDITRVDFVLDSGRWTEKHPLIAHSVAKLFKSGTNGKTAFQMSEAIDHLGSTISVYTGYHGFNITIYAMRKNLQATLELMFECLSDDIFPVSEFENYVKNSKAKQKVQEEKTEFIADRAYRNAVFGKNHPYGYSSEISFIDELKHEDLVSYFVEEVKNKKPVIYISGTYSELEISLLESIFSGTNYPEKKVETAHAIENQNLPLYQKISKKGSAQSSIAIGYRSINKLHPDFGVMSLTNTIFGGYFGSRLMSNIREDKGYTYGIYSSLQTYRHDGSILIQTETSGEHVDACIREIESEINKLQNDLISSEELKQARNYLLGKYLSRMDGAFAQTETFKNYQIESLNIHAFNKFAEIIKSTTPEEIRNMAQKHYNFATMYQVVAGQ